MNILRDCILEIIAFLVLIIFVAVCMCTNWFWFDETPPWRNEKTVQSEQPNIDWPSTETIEVENELIQGYNPQIHMTFKCLVNPEHLEMLANIIDAECGDDWCTDKLQLYVGSVVLNRIKSENYPDTLYEVLTQRGQYGGENHWKYNGRTPSERTYDNTKKLLIEGSILPDNVVFQANFVQGSGVYEEVQGVYFCYG